VHDPGMLVVSPESEDVLKSYLRQHDVQADIVGDTSFATLKVLGTPTLVLLDGPSIVRGVWVGWLDSSKEAEVVKAITKE